MLSNHDLWTRAYKEHTYLLDRELLDKIRNEVSGLRAWNTVSKISQYHRIRGGGEGSDYNKCTEWLADYLENIGCQEVKIKKFKADGWKKYYEWASLVGWRVNEAELWLIEPEKKLINRFTEQPTCLLTYSQGGEFESEVVFIDQGKTKDDYLDKDVEDKLVFAIGGNAPKVYREAVLQRGALGVIVGPSNREDRSPYTDLIEVGRISPVGEEVDKTRFGFSISRSQQNELKSFFDSGKKVVMKAKIDAELIEGDMPVVEAKLIGCKHPNQEIIIMGHLDHYKQGANDNASGSAGMVEIIRTLKALIDRGDLPPLERTLRFLFLPEIHGTTAYLSEHEELKHLGITGINLDMIGEDTELCQGTFNLTCTPYSTPGYIDDIIINLLPWLEEDEFYEEMGRRHKLNYRIKPYSGGSDHVMFNDSTFSIPSVMLGHDDIFHHTNHDTTDKCDPTEMKRVICLAEAASILLANAKDVDAIRIAEEIHGNARTKITKRTIKSLQMLRHTAEIKQLKLVAELYSNLLEYPNIQSRVEIEKIEKIIILCTKPESQNILKKIIDSINSHALYEKEKLQNGYELILKQHKISKNHHEQSETEKEAIELIPKRLIKGPLMNDRDRRNDIWEKIKEKLGENRAEWHEEHKKEAGENLSSKIFEILNLMDGERTILDIRNTISCELDETSTSYTLNFIKDLEKLGLITFN